MNRKSKIVAGSAAVLLSVGALAACGDFQKALEPYKDAPVANRDETGPADLINMPDGFSNVAAKCDKGHGIRVYVVYHGDSSYGAVTAVPDEKCK